LRERALNIAGDRIVGARFSLDDVVQVIYAGGSGPVLVSGGDDFGSYLDRFAVSNSVMGYGRALHELAGMNSVSAVLRRGRRV
jgi:hypothetical protein